MPPSKVFSSTEEVVENIPHGAVIMVGGVRHTGNTTVLGEGPSRYGRRRTHLHLRALVRFGL